MQNNLGILGFGVVGKSALKYFKKKYKNLSIKVWDKRDLSAELLSMQDSDLLKGCDVVNHALLSLDRLSENCEKIFVSPGFSLKQVNDLDQNKILCELDLFADFFKKQVVAITGSLGKTSITSFLNELTQKMLIKSCAGGNIGNALLDLIDQQEFIDIAFIELSSFQLRFSKTFAPQIAVFNNFYSNHLDWHETIEDYFQAKCKIFEYQDEGQFALFPISFLNDKLPNNLKENFLEKIKKIKSRVCFVGQDFKNDFKLIKEANLLNVFIFSYQDNNFVFYEIVNNQIIFKQVILDLKVIPNFSFEFNWLFIITVLFLLNLDLDLLQKVLLNFEAKSFREHRLELFFTKNNIDFYNDSKSTVYQATIEALEKLNKNGRPIILILGGLSKGVDRSPLIQYLKNLKNIKNVFCFGADCKTFSLYPFCSRLEDTVDAAFDVLMPGDQVLFSPSGSSFDLFKNYQDRGDDFKKMILKKSEKFYGGE